MKASNIGAVIKTNVFRYVYINLSALSTNTRWQSFKHAALILKKLLKIEVNFLWNIKNTIDSDTYDFFSYNYQNCLLFENLTSSPIKEDGNT